MTNFFTVVPMAKKADFSVWPMFVVLLLTCPITIFAIFHYKKRMLQARLCVFNIVLILLWMALCAFYVYTYQTKDEVCHLEMTFSSCLPALSLILYILARRGIIKDEKLVKAANRKRKAWGDGVDSIYHMEFKHPLAGSKVKEGARQRHPCLTYWWFTALSCPSIPDLFGDYA